MSGGKLFCLACREELNLKKNSVRNHLQSSKHSDRKSKLELREQEISSGVAEAQQCVPTRGESLPMQQQVYRVKVVRSFLRAAVPHVLLVWRVLKAV